MSANLQWLVSRRFLHRLLAVGAVALVLLLTVLAASPELHARLHGNAGEADHECVITLYQHGVVAATAAVALLVVALVLPARVAAAPAALDLGPPRYWLPPALAPPAC
jgi:riboflavin biosynthesis pyrimidine reductase